jgi:hypothetical protein
MDGELEGTPEVDRGTPEGSRKEKEGIKEMEKMPKWFRELQKEKEKQERINKAVPPISEEERKKRQAIVDETLGMDVYHQTEEQRNWARSIIEPEKINAEQQVEYEEWKMKNERRMKAEAKKKHNWITPEWAQKKG